MYDKKLAVKVEGGRPVLALDLRSFQQAGDYEALKKECEANAKAEAEEAKAKAEAEAAAREEADRKARLADYYAKWRFCDACKSLIVLWLVDDGGVSGGLKDEAVSALKEADASAERGCESLLAAHPAILKSYEALFGKKEE